jgi:hypothetical protein
MADEPEPTEKQRRNATILLMLIADSERALREGRWITQEQMEKLLHDRFGV